MDEKTTVLEKTGMKWAHLERLGAAVQASGTVPETALLPKEKGKARDKASEVAADGVCGLWVGWLVGGWWWVGVEGGGRKEAEEEGWIGGVWEE